MASRPIFHPFLKAGDRCGVPQSRRKYGRVLPWENPDVIHFVGTGWDFAGFGFLELAREQRTLNPVWPATHPGQWHHVINPRLTL